MPIILLYSIKNIVKDELDSLIFVTINTDVIAYFTY